MNWDRVEGFFGKDILAQLAKKWVAIIGLGSGGGFVATSLAMSGIGHFILIDDDTLDAVNIVRHVGDQRDLGRYKVEVVADLIRHRNPQAQVKSIIGRVENHQNQLAEADLVVCAVDGENAKFLINELCLGMNLPAIYAGVYERGEGGDVAMIYPYEGPCYACWASNLRDGYIPPSPDDVEQLDYGLIQEDGTLKAEPALWLHVVRVAAAQADLALNMLLKNQDLPANTVILANQALEIITGRMTPPHSAEWVNIARDPACLVCGSRSKRLASQEEQSLDDLAHDILLFEEESEE